MDRSRLAVGLGVVMVAMLAEITVRKIRSIWQNQPSEITKGKWVLVVGDPKTPIPHPTLVREIQCGDFLLVTKVKGDQAYYYSRNVNQNEAIALDCLRLAPGPDDNVPTVSPQADCYAQAIPPNHHWRPDFKYRGEYVYVTKLGDDGPIHNDPRQVNCHYMVSPALRYIDSQKLLASGKEVANPPVSEAKPREDSTDKIRYYRCLRNPHGAYTQKRDNTDEMHMKPGEIFWSHSCDSDMVYYFPRVTNQGRTLSQYEINADLHFISRGDTVPISKLVRPHAHPSEPRLLAPGDEVTVKEVWASSGEWQYWTEFPYVYHIPRSCVEEVDPREYCKT